jgi:ATP-dependent DNA helicase RecQ
MDLHGALRQHFGFDDFLPGQERVVDCLMAGRSAAAVFPTGGGKSLCYQLPACLLDGLTLVVSPLIALMKDQIDQLTRRGVAAARLDSTLSNQDWRSLMDDLDQGRLRLLYVAPERFTNERFRTRLADWDIALFAIDEAHCISEWGHNFRPDYLKLAQAAQDCGAGRVLALTATATPQVLTDICDGFSIAPDDAVTTGFYRPNLALRCTPVTSADRDRTLVDRVRAAQGSTIVYVTLQRTAERVAELLRGAGVEAEPYHAGMEAETRSAIQDRFIDGRTPVVVATIAFGMGIDKADIRAVFHYNLAKSLENLSQEIGRAGRDGQPALCETLACRDDLNTLGNFAYGDTPDLGAVERLVEELGEESEMELALSGLGARHDIRPIVLRTILTYLELDGRLAAGTPVYGSCRFKPLATSAEILDRFSGERRDFLHAVFCCAEKKRVWLELDMDAAAETVGSSRDRIVKALDYLAEQELLEVEMSRVLFPYRWLRAPDDPVALARQLHRRLVDHERREIHRLQSVVELLESHTCLAARLAAYFGEELEEDCGSCTVCVDGPTILPPATPAEIDDEIWRRADALRSEHEVLSASRPFARFLVGLRSPALTRAKLHRHELFGVLDAVAFPVVLARAELAEAVARRRS